MKYSLPNNRYIQTNRSDVLGDLVGSFNIDLQSNVGKLRLSDKLLKLDTPNNIYVPTAIGYAFGKRWVVGPNDIATNDGTSTGAFTSVKSTEWWERGGPGTGFSITNPSGNVFRYTYTSDGDDPLISSTTFPIGATVAIDVNAFSSGNNTVSTGVPITGSGTNYFEITKAGGVVESNKTLVAGDFIAVKGGDISFTNESDICVPYAPFNYLDSLFINGADGCWYVKRSYGTGLVDERFRFISGGKKKMTFFKKTNRVYSLVSYANVSSYGGNSLFDVANALNNDVYSISLTNNGITYGVVATTIEASSNFIWVGMRKVIDGTAISSTGNHGYIAQWDGVSNQLERLFPLPTSGVAAMAVSERDEVFAIDTGGRILKYTGNSFDEIARLPFRRETFQRYENYTPAMGNFIHPNGMKVTKNNTLLINIRTLWNSESEYSEFVPGGIWELDLSTGNLTHRYSYTRQRLSDETPSDHGQHHVRSVGLLSIEDTTTGSYGIPSLHAGAATFSGSDLDTTDYGSLFVDAPLNNTLTEQGQRSGYVVSTWFESPDIAENWVKLWTNYKIGDGDRIEFKYRLTEEKPVVASITWDSTTSFTTETDVTAYTGMEVEVLHGPGGGACRTIASVVPFGENYIVTLDKEIDGVSGTAKARFQKWIKLGEIDEAYPEFGQFPIAEVNPRIQIKVVFEFSGDSEFGKLIIVSTPYHSTNES